MQDLNQEWSVQRLKWFTHGYYSSREENNEIIIRDLRMGAEPAYYFNFVVGERQGEKIVPVVTRNIETEFSSDKLSAVWQRIRDSI